jgi:hypothetical protein
MREATARLQEHFGARLLFVGLQGSYRRGEAREDSDIDIMAILDSLNVADLAAYRAILRSLPEGEKASGFTCGREELAAWPPFELFQFAQDTDAWHGDLASLLPPVTRQDTVNGARATVSGLHHYTAYLYLSGDAAARADALQGVYKSFFFAMQLVRYLRTGVYTRTKKELLPMLSGNEAELLRRGMDPDSYEGRKRHDPDALFQDMLTWTGSVMRELAREG